MYCTTPVLMMKYYEASHIRQFHLSGCGLALFLTDNWGSTVYTTMALYSSHITTFHIIQAVYTFIISHIH